MNKFDDIVQMLKVMTNISLVTRKEFFFIGIIENFCFRTILVYGFFKTALQISEQVTKAPPSRIFYIFYVSL